MQWTTPTDTPKQSSNFHSSYSIITLVKSKKPTNQQLTLQKSLKLDFGKHNKESDQKEKSSQLMNKNGIPILHISKQQNKQ